MATRLCPRCKKPLRCAWTEGRCTKCRRKTAYNADLCLHPPDRIQRVDSIHGWCHKCGEVLVRGERYYFSERF